MKYIIILFLFISCNNKVQEKVQPTIPFISQDSTLTSITCPHRYFLISFWNKKITGDYSFECINFFTREEIVEAIGEGDIIITNIYEFKSKKDYDIYMTTHKIKRKDLPKKQSFLC